MRVKVCDGDGKFVATFKVGTAVDEEDFAQQMREAGIPPADKTTIVQTPEDAVRFLSTASLDEIVCHLKTMIAMGQMPPELACFNDKQLWGVAGHFQGKARRGELRY